MSAESALMNYMRKAAGTGQRRKRGPNKKPEKELEKSVLKWLEKYGFHCNVVESKAVYSVSAGRYLQGQTDQGFADIVGNSAAGRAVFIELKAPGRRSTIRPSQTHFLEQKIKTNCFAVCIDSIEMLEYAWKNFKALSPEEAKKFLRNLLPKKRKNERENDNLFE